MVKTYGSAVYGVEAMTITIEVDIGGSSPHYFTVGLPDSAVREAIMRVESALNNSGFRMHRQKIVVNLSPADIRKEGSAYDLPIAIAILAASGQIKADRIGAYLIMGELSLDGLLQPVKGALPIAIQGRKEKFADLSSPNKMPVKRLS